LQNFIPSGTTDQAGHVKKKTMIRQTTLNFDGAAGMVQSPGGQSYRSPSPGSSEKDSRDGMLGKSSSPKPLLLLSGVIRNSELRTDTK
jgi:hypothetical protein